VTGPAGKHVGIVTSTDFKDWIGFVTNLAPFQVTHTNSRSFRSGFYRAVEVP